MAEHTFALLSAGVAGIGCQPAGKTTSGFGLGTGRFSGGLRPAAVAAATATRVSGLMRGFELPDAQSPRPTKRAKVGAAVLTAAGEVSRLALAHGRSAVDVHDLAFGTIPGASLDWYRTRYLSEVEFLANGLLEMPGLDDTFWAMLTKEIPA